MNLAPTLRKNYNLVDAAWKQMTTVGLQSSPRTKQPPHDYMFKEVTVSRARLCLRVCKQRTPYLCRCLLR
jgi:hypothetical protein